MGSGKKRKPSKKEMTIGSPAIGYWEAPPEVPVHNIRRMLTSLEKELELLTGANEIKKKKDDAVAQNVSVTVSSSLNDSGVSSKASQQMQQSITPTKPLETAFQIFSGGKSETKNNNGAPRKSLSAVRQTVSYSPSAIVPLHKAPSLTRYSTCSFDRYKTYKTRVLQAYQNRKIFTIYGSYYEVRAALLSRGWIEKLPHESHRGLQQLSQHNLLLNAKNKNDYETVLLSKMLENYPAYFIWQPKNMYHYYSYAMPFRNRIKLRSDFDFTTKEGLVTCINRAQERGILGAEQIIHPRTYRLSYTNEVSQFDRNYRLTCCFSLILYISEKTNTSEIFSPLGEVNPHCLDFALLRIQRELSLKKGWPSEIADFAAIAPTEWMAFMNDSGKVLNKNMKIRSSPEEEAQYMERIRNAIEDVKKHWPMFKMDGHSNIWIVKPANYCRGYGILLMTDLDRILNQARIHFRMRYIAQKYIERPLLIYKAKFDIRQYVLVTIRDCITIYLYGDCYVKFSSQEFNLKNLHESVHVTNFSIQSKYKNGERSDLLPPHNMWDLADLKSYFKTIKKDNIWENFIFPRIINTVISVMMASFDSAELVMNAFEMYGLDFMLTEDFEPVLLEVNATPDLMHSTCVTARLCPASIRDLVKVVVDLPGNPHANIGNWRPVYKVAWARSGTNKPVISQYANLLKSAGYSTPIPKLLAVNPAKPSTRPAPKDYKKKKSPIKKDVPLTTKTNSSSNKYSTKTSSLNTKVTNAFVKDVADKVHATKWNLSRKEAIGKQVFQAIETMYSMKPTPDYHLFKSNKASAKKKKGKSYFADEKFLKELGDALYSKIWR